MGPLDKRNKSPDCADAYQLDLDLHRLLPVLGAVDLFSSRVHSSHHIGTRTHIGELSSRDAGQASGAAALAVLAFALFNLALYIGPNMHVDANVVVAAAEVADRRWD